MDELICPLCNCRGDYPYCGGCSSERSGPKTEAELKADPAWYEKTHGHGMRWHQISKEGRRILLAFDRELHESLRRIAKKGGTVEAPDKLTKLDRYITKVYQSVYDGKPIIAQASQFRVICKRMEACHA